MTSLCSYCIAKHLLLLRWNRVEVRDRFNCIVNLKGGLRDTVRTESAETTTIRWVPETDPIQRPRWSLNVHVNQRSLLHRPCGQLQFIHHVMYSIFKQKELDGCSEWYKSIVWLGFSRKVFFLFIFFSPFLLLMEFGFLVTLTFALLSWGHWLDLKIKSDLLPQYTPNLLVINSK